jgi:hypothetical protein
MMHAVRRLGLAATLVFVSTAAFVPEARAQSTPATAAYVYIQIQGPEGAVYGFNASSTGKLSAISGSPFKPAGQIVGSTPTKFFTLGETLLHSYGIGSNGAIQSQIAQAPIYDYAGSECGDSNFSNGVDSAVLDHTGKYVYVLLQNGPENCAAYQTYAISKAGDFTFLGDDVAATGINIEPVSTSLSLPSILGSETFAYATVFDGHLSNLIGFRRESAGALESLQFTETDPTLDGYFSNYTPADPDASPTGNYAVVQLFPYDSNPPQLGSYTVDSQGNISSTNTSSNMPTATGNLTVFSPSGSLLADWGGVQQGISLYHFNGAAPLTLYKTLLNGTTINQAAWDGSGHLYVTSNSNNELYVFTVTATSVTQDAAWAIGAPYSMIVVSE